MGGGLMQLVAYGAQDIYLTGNPQITFFKVVYRRHTNFAMESIEQTFSGVCTFGNKVSCTISRNGDLVHRMYLEVHLNRRLDTLKTGERELNWFGERLLRQVDVEIGGQLIDRHYGEWLHVWNQLSSSVEEFHKYQKLVSGDSTRNDNPATSQSDVGMSTVEDIVYIPLQFWFNRNPGLALPLIALQYHEVKINIELHKQEDIVWINTPWDTIATRSVDNPTTTIQTLKKYNDDQGVAGTADAAKKLDILTCQLYCDYIFLDTDERRRFAQVSHEYLIEQLQFNETVSAARSEQRTPMNIELDFNHPCKEIVWVAQKDVFDKTFIYYDSELLNGSVTLGDNNCYCDLVANAKLQLNGHDRSVERDGPYYRIVQPYQHHTGGAVHGTGLNLNNIQDSTLIAGQENGYVYSYSFALRPEDHQPSGTCNFSRIDNAVLNLNLNEHPTGIASIPSNGQTSSAGYLRNNDVNVRVYATNYNVLRIMSGMGGLAYSN